MLSEKVCFSSGIFTNEYEYCKTASELFNNKSLYILLERFSNIICKERPEYNEFLNRYFSDEGYVDIWRVPHLLIDLVNRRYDLHETELSDEEFRVNFMSFIGEFYNYCIKKSKLLVIESCSFSHYKSNMLHMRKNQCLYELISETYCKVFESLNSYIGIKKGDE